jgi:ferrochelatase
MEAPYREHEPIGVILMEYGEPATLDEVAPYLRAHAGGHEPVLEDVNYLAERCRRVWGDEQGESAAGRIASALEDELTQRHGDCYRVARGARHWQPSVSAALADLVRLGMRRAIILPLSPYASVMSLRDYQRAIEQAQTALDRSVELQLIVDWPDLVGWRTTLTAHAQMAFARLVRDDCQANGVLFLAHSVAESVRKPETAYRERLNQDARQLAETLGCARWRLAYYGAEGPGQWLGPDGLEALEDLAREGARQLLTAPLATVYDNVEVCYELDVRLAGRAAELGLAYCRAAIPNEAPALVADLATLIHTTSASFRANHLSPDQGGATRRNRLRPPPLDP